MTDARLIEFARQMRREPTPAERTLWQELRNRQLVGLKFRRQHPLGLYIADFYSASAAFVIELDGDSHTTPESVQYDLIRHEFLRGLDLEVIRFWNSDVHDNLDGVLETILRACQEREGTRRLRLPASLRRLKNDAAIKN